MLDLEQQNAYYLAQHEHYLAVFRPLSHNELVEWFKETEQRHALMLSAMATALRCLPCAEDERQVISSLFRAASSMGERVPVFQPL